MVQPELSEGAADKPFLTAPLDLSLRRRMRWALGNLELSPGLSILDAGCGDGIYIAGLLASRPKCIIAIDRDETQLSILRKRYDKYINVVGAPLIVQRRDIENMGLGMGVGRIDRALCTEVLEHVLDPALALSELYRVLRPGGVLVITVPNADYPALWDPISWTLERLGIQPRSGIWNQHLRLYRADEIRALCEQAGFVVEKLELLTHYCIPFSMQILRAGALLKDRIPIPGTDRHGPGPGKWNPLRWILRMFEWVDGWDDRGVSSVNIALKVRKNKNAI